MLALGKLRGPGGERAPAVRAYAGSGQVRPAEATCDSLGHRASNSTRKSARVQSLGCAVRRLLAETFQTKSAETGFSPRRTP